MLKRIYEELISIRKELQAIRNSMKLSVKIDGQEISKATVKSICDKALKDERGTATLKRDLEKIEEAKALVEELRQEKYEWHGLWSKSGYRSEGFECYNLAKNKYEVAKKVFDLMLPLLKDIRDFKTNEIVMELQSREGVEVVRVEPHTDKTVTVNGPAIVLIVTD